MPEKGLKPTVLCAVFIFCLGLTHLHNMSLLQKDEITSALTKALAINQLAPPGNF